jgi:beta-lactam-binding protein with PASTA domain
MTLEQATATLTEDGFVLGEVTGVPDGYEPTDDSIVIDQRPAPGQRREAGRPIDLDVTDPAALPTCPLP